MSNSKYKNQANKNITVTLPKDVAERLLLLRKLGCRSELFTAIQNHLEAIVSMYETHSNVNQHSWKTAKVCPECKNGVLLEKARKGDVKPSFISCSTFPTCRHSESLKKVEK